MSQSNGLLAYDPQHVAVRLVLDERGTWRWFFGRDRAFVETQFARFPPETVTPPP